MPDDGNPYATAKPIRSPRRGGGRAWVPASERDPGDLKGAFGIFLWSFLYLVGFTIYAAIPEITEHVLKKRWYSVDALIIPLYLLAWVAFIANAIATGIGVYTSLRHRLLKPWVLAAGLLWLGCFACIALVATRVHARANQTAAPRQTATAPPRG